MNILTIEIPLCACKKLKIPYAGKRLHTTTQSTKVLKDLNVTIPDSIKSDTIQLVSIFQEAGKYRIVA